MWFASVCGVRGEEADIGSSMRGGLKGNGEEEEERLPPWLRRKLPRGFVYAQTQNTLRKHKIRTVCEEAKCPNQLECFSKKSATFLVLGKSCTRACSFCDVDFSSSPPPPDKEEPERIAQAAKALSLNHVVITMVTRDDLADQGASHVAETIQRVREELPHASIEVLTSDFSGDRQLIDVVLEEKPEIFNHNIETVRRLTPRVRHCATYARTIQLLSYAYSCNKASFIKSGIMVGIGEREGEVEETILDLYSAGCSIITIGQYLQPKKGKLPIASFVHPKQFRWYEEYGYSIGVQTMYCAPFVRSSYNAHLLKKGNIGGKLFRGRV